MSAQILPPSSVMTNMHATNGYSNNKDMDTPLSSPNGNDDGQRGRRRNREEEDGDGSDPGDGADGSGQGGSSKKRRRSRKGMDKKFECPHESCGKSYSRAEHLYRHQLNHNPKQIYHCDFPDCHRSFVRQDLCARHKERHTARGSQLLRRDNFMHHPNPIVLQAQKAKVAAAQSPTTYQNGPYSNGTRPLSTSLGGPNGLKSESSTPIDPSMQSPSLDRQNTQSLGTLSRSRSDDSFRTPESIKSDLTATHPRATNFANAPTSNYNPQNQRANADGFARPNANAQAYNSAPYMPNNQNFARPLPPQNQHPPPSPSGYQSGQSFPPLSTLPPPNYSTMSQATNPDGRQFPSSQTEALPTADTRMGGASDNAMIEAATPTFAMPIFGGQGIERSPFAMADDFAAWLFNDAAFGPNTSPLNYPGQAVATPGVGGNANFNLQAPYFSHDPMVSGYFPQPLPPQRPMAVNSLIDTNLHQMALSEERRQQIIDLIETRFNDDHAPVKSREDILSGHNRDDDQHLLSLNMMQTYIGSYWLHFHPQMPILHKPTFEANKCPELLLIAIISLGASCLEKRHGYETTKNCSELSNFLAWHLRWEIFMAKDSRPPAKLWVFQALLLLEIFEKMYSTRPLHERAHIHHATTLTLMRRGSSLIGRSANDSPPSGHNGPSRHGSANGGSSAYTYTPDEWWNQWIINEATRRAAFAAFVMDSIHATMFGHSAVMVAHEMRLPLPCDEALWSATSSAEIGRVEQSLSQHGIKPTTFLDGLKKTLSNQPVRTNSFGRTILMAGLLSVSWHMNQRDLQVSSLGVTQALGGRDKWRGALTRAFDFWKADLDDSIAKQGDPTQTPYSLPSRPDDENIFENRTVLHHLAHMAMHVDIVDCQIFAGATRLLGRSITSQDYSGAQRRMKEGWAPTARARDATFYALRFLCQVLMPDEHGSPHQRPVTQQVGRDARGLYSARDDFLLHRPWVLYFATLIVWSYGYALDGPIKPLYALTTYDQVNKDWQGYLNRIGKVSNPADLQHITNRNCCLGLLVFIRDLFGNTRWELTNEAANLLDKCIVLLAGGQEVSLPPSRS